MHRTHFAYVFVCRWALGCFFWLLWIMLLWMGVHVSVWYPALNSLGYVPRSGFAESDSIFKKNFLRFFLMWSILKVFIEIVAVLFLFWFFGHEVCGIERAPLALEGEILTTGSQGSPFKKFQWSTVHVQCCVSFRSAESELVLHMFVSTLFLDSFPTQVITESWVELIYCCC